MELLKGPRQAPRLGVSTGMGKLSHGTHSFFLEGHKILEHWPGVFELSSPTVHLSVVTLALGSHLSLAPGPPGPHTLSISSSQS